MNSPVRLNLGCWKRYLPGFIHIDLCDLPHIDLRSGVDRLSMFSDESVDLIYASHVLEYFDRIEACRVLEEWHRVLKHGGILRLAVPDFESLLKVYKMTDDLSNILGPLYGKMLIEGTDRVIYHKTVYDMKDMNELLAENGFSDVKRYRWQDTSPHDEIDDHSQAYYPHMDKKNGVLTSLNVEAKRV